jgi:hypothetical protein
LHSLTPFNSLFAVIGVTGAEFGSVTVLNLSGPLAQLKISLLDKKVSYSFHSVGTKGSFSHIDLNLKLSAVTNTALFFDVPPVVEVETPLFHNNLPPDLIQVNFLPNSTVDVPNFEHLPPAFIAALAGD